MSKLTTINSELQLIIKSIKLVVFDFDGVFTDNRVIVSQSGNESVFCWRSDGIGLRRLDEIGLSCCILSSEINSVVSVRASKLKIPLMQGVDNKIDALKKIADERKINLDNVAYVGNDINDLECLESVKFPIGVADAYSEILPMCKFQTQSKGGYGAVREVCDLFYNALSK